MRGGECRSREGLGSSVKCSVRPHPQTSHFSIPWLRPWRPGLCGAFGDGAVVNEGAVGTWAPAAQPDAGGQSRSSGWLSYSRRVCLPGEKTIQRHQAASESPHHSLPCRGTWGSPSVPACGQEGPQGESSGSDGASSERHTQELPMWHFPKVSTGVTGGEGGVVWGGRWGGWGGWSGRGKPPRTLHPTTLCLLGHSGGGAGGLHHWVGVGWREGSVLLYLLAWHLLSRRLS